jgi:excisionase family DNA binding protein
MDTLEKRYFTVAEAAQELGIPRRTLYNWIGDGKAKPVKLPGFGLWYFTAEEVERLREVVNHIPRYRIR